MSVSLTPALAKKSYESVEITSVNLADVVQANGKKAYLEMTATMNGNLTQHAIDLPGSSKGSGIMIRNLDSGYVYTLGVHTYDNCDYSDCGNYVIHGHKSKLEPSVFCTDKDYQYRSIPDDTSDFAVGHIKYKVGSGKTIVKLLDIPVTEKFLPSYQSMCNSNYVNNVGTASLYETKYFSDVNIICVKLSQDTIMTSYSPIGFTTKKTPDICASP